MDFPEPASRNPRSTGQSTDQQLSEYASDGLFKPERQQWVDSGRRMAAIRGLDTCGKVYLAS